MAVEVLLCEAVGYQFGDDLVAGNEIDQRDVFHLDEHFSQHAEETRQGSGIAHHLGHAEESGLEGGRAAGDKGGVGVTEQLVGMTLGEHVDLVTTCQRLVVVMGDAWCSGNDDLIVCGQTVGDGEHRREVVFDFLLAAATEHSDDGLGTMTIDR